MDYKFKYLIFVAVLSVPCIMNKCNALAFGNGVLAYIMRCYFDDIVGSIIMLMMITMLFPLISNNMRKLYQIELFMFVCGLFWEFVTPLYRRDVTADLLDIIAYMFGGMCFWMIDKKLRRQDKI